MKSKDRLLSYTLSVGFVVLILIFLILLITISRFVFEGTNTITDHVTETKTILDNIQEVERSVDSTDSAKIDTIKLDVLENNYEKDIQDVSYMNIKDKTSIISLAFNSTIGVTDTGIYYLKLENISGLEQGEKIVFKSDSQIRTGYVFTVKDDYSLINIVNFDQKERLDINYSDVIGKVVLEYGK